MSATATVYTKGDRPDWTSCEVNEVLKRIACGAISERKGTELINNRCGTRVARSTVRRRVEMIRCCMKNGGSNVNVLRTGESQQEALLNAQTDTSTGEAEFGDVIFDANNFIATKNLEGSAPQNSDWTSKSVTNVKICCVVKYRETEAFAVVDDNQIVGKRNLGELVNVQFEEGCYLAVLLFRTVNMSEATRRCNEHVLNNNIDLVMTMRRKKAFIPDSNNSLNHTDMKTAQTKPTDDLFLTPDGSVSVQSLLNDVHDLRYRLDRIEFTLSSCQPYQNRSSLEGSETSSPVIHSSCDMESGSCVNVSNEQERCTVSEASGENDASDESDYCEGERSTWSAVDLALCCENPFGHKSLSIEENLNINERSGAVSTFARNLAAMLFVDENALSLLCQRLNRERICWVREVINICFPSPSEESEAKRWQQIVHKSQEFDRRTDAFVSSSSSKRTNNHAVLCKQEPNTSDYDGDFSFQDASSLKQVSDILLMASNLGTDNEAGTSRVSAIDDGTSDGSCSASNNLSSETTVANLFWQSGILRSVKGMRFSRNGCQSKRRSVHRETSEERAARLSRDAERARRRRERESSEERAIRLAKCALRARLRRERETSEERTLRLAREAASARNRRRRETPGERQRRLIRMRRSESHWRNKISREDRTQQCLTYIRQLTENYLLASPENDDQMEVRSSADDHEFEGK